ncbi:hypothetical protein ASE36_04695 [Rhizobium sp. Root274]|uniref:hypothetical protein n=1 Tax=unclassified Rhizobium TaxID=2613769 RepID=UPI000715FF54|nr:MULTISPECIES: hypothetical protein [unclassified Rhizobium]KQW31543.1 hypothetical protein ASC71_04700 [Rhizobium sp. Root1240]KRD33083.1 hypothetical protein ASE36_04695 [Rhizobium sp. Root274]
MILIAPLLSLIAMGLIAAWGHRNIAPERRSLPIQWSVSGAVNREVPRLVAVAAIPVAIAAAMILVAYLSRHDPADRNMALIWISIIGPGIEAFYLAFLARMLDTEE